MEWRKLDDMWRKRAEDPKKWLGGIKVEDSTWDVPGEGPLSVRVCSRPGVPASKYTDMRHTEKTSVVLHLTAGYGDFMGLMGGNGPVSVHFMLGRDGSVWQIVPTELIANHATWWNNNSIGIEVDNIGPLRKQGDVMKSFYKDTYCKADEKDLYLEKSFNGAKYWATFTEAQYRELGRLLKAICFKHQIPRIILPEPQRYSKFTEETRKTFRGICTHINSLPENRSDIGPFIDWPRLIQDSGLTEADCIHPPAEVLGTWRVAHAGAPSPAGPPAASSGDTGVPVQIDNHTLRIRVGKHGGRICLSVKQPGDPIPTAPSGSEAPVPKAAGKRDAFIAAVLNFVGTPYKTGSADPAHGLDGANMIAIAMKRVGVFKDAAEVPKDAEHLSALWHVVGLDPVAPPEPILPGDLVWFGRGDHDNDPMQHPMVYLGGGTVVGPVPDGGKGNGAVQIIRVDKVPEHFAGWMHVDDFGSETSHTDHPGEPPRAGEKVTGALLPAAAGARYDALKEVVKRARGKWEDAKGKVNLVGVKNLHDRCMISPKPDDWNDTLFAAFLDDDGHKCCLELLSSLNPGTDTKRAETWQLWEGSYRFKLQDGKVLRPEGKVKAWFDKTGMGSPRLNDPEQPVEIADVKPGAPPAGEKKDAPPPPPVRKSGAKPAPTSGPFIFDAGAKKPSLKFGMRMMRALMDWELRQEDGELKGCIYSSNGRVSPYQPRVKGIGMSEWPDIAGMAIAPVRSTTVEGKEYRTWRAFGMEWGGTGSTNCCYSQMAAIFACNPDGILRIKKADGLLEVDLVKDPPAPGIKGHPETDKARSVGYGTVFIDTWINGLGAKYSGADGKKLFKDTSLSGPAWAMKWLGVGEEVTRWGCSDEDLKKVRMGDSGQWFAHNWLVGDVRYEVTLKGRKTPVYVDQSDFARGDHPQPQPKDEGGYKMTRDDCAWIEAHEEDFEARLKAFLEAKTIQVDGEDKEVVRIRPLACRVFSANAQSFGKWGTSTGEVYGLENGAWVLDEGQTKLSRMNLGISRGWSAFSKNVHEKFGKSWGFARWYDNAAAK